MAKKGVSTSGSIRKAKDGCAPAATGAISTVYPRDNASLKKKYDRMHAIGKAAWFDSGDLERLLILNMGEPWNNRRVLEIGCGEGDLCAMLSRTAKSILGVDYSETAIQTAKIKHPECFFVACDYRDVVPNADVIVMQGVLEHLDNPVIELKWIIDNLKPTTVITTSPCFLNPRGIIWMALNMLGGVMSKTDLHYLNPWDFEEFCGKNRYTLTMESCDYNWAFGKR